MRPARPRRGRDALKLVPAAVAASSSVRALRRTIHPIPQAGRTSARSRPPRETVDCGLELINLTRMPVSRAVWLMTLIWCENGMGTARQPLWRHPPQEPAG
jgi:hypothetical protein